MDELKEINLTVNGKEYKIVNPKHNVFLSEWLRDSLHLKGNNASILFKVFLDTVQHHKQLAFL